MENIINLLINILKKKAIEENVNSNSKSSNDDFLIKPKYTYIVAYLKQVEKNLYKYGSKTQHRSEDKKINSLKQLNCNDLIDLRLFYRSLNFYIYTMFNFNTSSVDHNKVNKTQKIANLAAELKYYDISVVCMVINLILDTNIQPENMHKLVRTYIETKLKENDTKSYKKVGNISDLEDFNKTTAKDQELKIDKRMNSAYLMVTLKTLTKSIQYFCEHTLFEDIEQTLYGHNNKTGIPNILLGANDHPKKSLYNFKSLKNLFAKSLAKHYQAKKAA